jgi:hypothetical protein
MINITTNIQDAIKQIKALPGKIDRVSKASLKEATDTITRIMRRPGLPVRYPIKWDSLKQKRYVIAKLRREGNLPYTRTGATEQAWQNKAIANGYEVSNIGHKAVFIYGTPSGEGIGGKVTASGQSHIHEGRWRLVRPVVDAVLARLPDIILRMLKVEVSG